MQPKTKQDLERIKQQWETSNDISYLQSHGYFVHLRLLSTMKQNRHLTDVISDLHNKMDIQLIKEERTVAVSNVMLKNFKELTEAILTLSTKDNGKPLNNEMAQIVKMVENAKNKHKTEIKKVADNYKKCLQDREVQLKQYNQNYVIQCPCQHESGYQKNKHMLNKI